jgi:antimicrobial peptide system SdpB family protein
MLALSTLLTLVCSEVTSLFRPTAGHPAFPSCDVGLSQGGLYCLPIDLDLLRWVAIGLLIVIASGWRPRLTGILHWWVSLSMQLNVTLTDGGDQITAILTLLLIPVTLTDPRRWHWQSASELPTTGWRVCAQITARIFLTAIRVQVAGVYFHAAVGKLAVDQWANGTALYYWLQESSHGAAAWQQPLLAPLLACGLTTVLMTWGVLVLEYFLSTALVMPRRAWKYMFYSGWLMHLSILFVQGIASFSVAMMAALILYLRPWDQPFVVPARARQWRPRLVHSHETSPAPLAG